MLFLIMLDYQRPMSEVDQHLAGHREFLQRHYAAGHFLLSGPKEPRTGGIILARAESREAVEQWISEDPFHQASVASFLVIPWSPSMAAEGWSKV